MTNLVLIFYESFTQISQKKTSFPVQNWEDINEQFMREKHCEWPRAYINMLNSTNLCN